MGRIEFSSSANSSSGDTPRHLIPYEIHPAHSSPGSSNNISPDTNCSSLNSTSTSASSNTRPIVTHHQHDLILKAKSENPIPSNINQSTSSASTNWKIQMEEEETEDFLPICDALFNVICLAAYFCHIVFDVLAAYSFYSRGQFVWFGVSISFIGLSMVTTQIVSYQWFKEAAIAQSKPCPSLVLILLHFGFCGVLWRYFKLFIPVDLRYLKSEVRDLCLLRLIHAFCEGAPMLLIQLYFICLHSISSSSSSSSILPDYQVTPTDLTIVSGALSLFIVCWALASFSKNVRRDRLHKLVLTWLGVIFQFLWRVGTVTSRVIALCVYATVYMNWIWLVIGLHWCSMLLWLISPKNVFYADRMSRLEKVGYAGVIAVIYIFCFINVQEGPSRQRVVIFYVTMFLENTLLISVWLIAVRTEILWYKDFVLPIVLGTFMSGIFFMSLYYKFFHVKKLSYEDNGTTRSGVKGSTCQSSADGDKMNGGSGYYTGVNSLQYDEILDPNGRNYVAHGQHHHNEVNDLGFQTQKLSPKPQMKKSSYAKYNGHIHQSSGIPATVPGVFNCRFNPAMKRKKKKPTSFVPPTTSDLLVSHDTSVTSTRSFPIEAVPLPSSQKDSNPINANNGKIFNQGWKLRPSCSDDESSTVSSRLDIQRKLHAKKQAELAQLKELEIEIREGKHERPSETDSNPHPQQECQQHQPPISKKQPWFRGDVASHSHQIHPNHSELLLDPAHFLCPQHSRRSEDESPAGVSYEQIDWINYYESVYHNNDGNQNPASSRIVMGESIPEEMMDEDLQHHHHHLPKRKQGDGCSNFHTREPYNYQTKSNSVDIECQDTLPQKFSLPEPIRSRGHQVKSRDHYSTNSSDGDVESGEDEKKIKWSSRTPHKSNQQRFSGKRRKKQPETPL